MEKASEDRETWLSPKKRRNFTGLMISIFFKDRSKKNVKYLSYLHRSVRGDSPSVMSPFWLQQNCIPHFSDFQWKIRRRGELVQLIQQLCSTRSQILRVLFCIKNKKQLFTRGLLNGLCSHDTQRRLTIILPGFSLELFSLLAGRKLFMFHLCYRCSSCQSRNVFLPACVGGSGSSSDLPSVSVIPDVICVMAAPRWMARCARHCFTVSGTAEGQNRGR